MRWSDIGKEIANYAPLIGTALLGRAGTTVGTLIAAKLGTEDTPQAVQNALTSNSEAVAKIQALQIENQTELRRIVLTAETARLAEVNATMRAEYAQEDKFVKRWRPTFGYSICFTWVVESIGFVSALLYTVIYHPESAGIVINAIAVVIGAMAVQWGIALSVLGVSVSARSDDKQVSAGLSPAPGVLGAIAQRIAGSKNQTKYVNPIE